MNIRYKKTLYPGLLLVAVAVGVPTWRHYTTALPENVGTVKAGVLYRCGEGSVFKFRNAVRDFHIKTIFCVRKVSNLDAERDMARKAGVEFIFRPVSSKKPVPEADYLEFLRVMQDPQRHPVLVHCAQGKHRTGFFVAVYRMVIDRWPLDKALKEMESYGFDLNTHTKLIDSLKAIDPEKIREKLRKNS